MRAKFRRDTLGQPIYARETYQYLEVSQNIDLAREDLAVLNAVEDAEQAITTSTIREQMHWADQSSQIRYRLDKLEERGLVETWHAEDRAEPHQMPPRVAEETEAGASIAADHRDDPETLPTEERLARVEKQLVRMRETYGEVKRRLVEVEEELDEYDDDLDDLSRKVDRIISAIGDSRNSAGDERE